MVASVTPSPKHGEKEVRESIRVLVQVCRAYGYEGRAETGNTEIHWMNLVQDCQGDWMKVIKYKLAAFYAAHKKQDQLPLAPFKVTDLPHQLLGGRLGRFMRAFLARSEISARTSFLESILQSKKGMPRAGKNLLKAKEEATTLKLTGIPVSNPRSEIIVEWGRAEFYDQKNINYVLNEDGVKEQLIRRVKELFSGKRLTTNDRIKAFFPSTSANYINNRKNAGAIGSILDHPTLLDGLRKPGGYLHTNTVRRGEKEERIEDEDIKEVSADTEAFDNAFKNLWIRLLGEASREIPNAEPVALPEALKIRVITKGPPFIQTVLRNLWKFLHSTLRAHRAFRLIGEPVTEEYLLDCLGQRLEQHEVYLSGDYEGATDNLKSWVSETIANAIADEIGLYDVERRLFLSSLTGHIIRGQKQTTGQLMGSITSFPILCIANAALSGWAYELSKLKKSLLRDMPIMINGDDIAMRIPTQGYKLWTKITGYAGLKESIGKTFISREFVNINSTNFNRDEANPKGFLVQKMNTITVGRLQYKVPTTQFSYRESPFRVTQYINMGLIKGMKRSGLKTGLNDQTDPSNNIGVRYREMIRLCPSHLRRRAHNQFVTEHRGFLSKTSLPWYIPEWLGGLGLIGLKKPSELDLRIAQMIIINWKSRHPKSLAHTVASWKTWELASKRVPKPYSVREKNQGCETYSQTVADACIDMLFDSEVKLSDLFPNDKPGEEDAIKLIRYNERFWRVKNYQKLCKPAKYDDILFKPVYNSYQKQIINDSSSDPSLTLD